MAKLITLWTVSFAYSRGKHDKSIAVKLYPTGTCRGAQLGGKSEQFEANKKQQLSHSTQALTVLVSSQECLCHVWLLLLHSFCSIGTEYASGLWSWVYWVWVIWGWVWADLLNMPTLVAPLISNKAQAQHQVQLVSQKDTFWRMSLTLTQRSDPTKGGTPAVAPPESKETRYYCPKCDLPFCVAPCFEAHNTEV